MRRKLIFLLMLGMAILFAQDIHAQTRKKNGSDDHRNGSRLQREAGGECQRDVRDVQRDETAGGAHRQNRKIFYHGIETRKLRLEGFAEWGVLRLGAQHSAA